MAATRQLYVELLADSSKYNASIDRAFSKLEGFAGKAEITGAKLTAAITLPLSFLGKKIYELSRDAAESLNKVNVVFGQQSEVVQKFASNSLKNYGLAKDSALEMASLFGDMATGMGINQEQSAKYSTTLVSLAADMASFKNISIDRAQTALTSIFTGETESLKALGIVMTEANLKAFAM
jgi:hypothetical protein